MCVHMCVRAYVCVCLWSGISLLDVVGKLFVRVLNNRLQLVVHLEEAVSDSRCAFRAGMVEVVLV